MKYWTVSPVTGLWWRFRKVWNDIVQSLFKHTDLRTAVHTLYTDTTLKHLQHTFCQQLMHVPRYIFLLHQGTTREREERKKHNAAVRGGYAPPPTRTAQIHFQLHTLLQKFIFFSITFYILKILFHIMKHYFLKINEPDSLFCASKTFHPTPYKY